MQDLNSLLQVSDMIGTWQINDCLYHCRVETAGLAQAARMCGVRGPPVRKLPANSTGVAQRESACPVLADQMAGDLLMLMQGNEAALQ